MTIVVGGCHACSQFIFYNAKPRNMLEQIIFSAIAGFFAKTTDEGAENPPPFPSFVFILAALAYGIILGCLAVSSPLSSLFLALAISAILAAKIDHPFHILGLCAFAGMIIFFQIAAFDPWLFSLFLAASLFDELALPLGRLLGRLSNERLYTPLAALAVLLAGGEWIFFAAIVSFDIAYRMAKFAMGKATKGAKKARRR